MEPWTEIHAKSFRVYSTYFWNSSRVLSISVITYVSRDPRECDQTNTSCRGWSGAPYKSVHCFSFADLKFNTAKEIKDTALQKIARDCLEWRHRGAMSSARARARVCMRALWALAKQRHSSCRRKCYSLTMKETCNRNKCCFKKKKIRLLHFVV